MAHQKTVKNSAVKIELRRGSKSDLEDTTKCCGRNRKRNPSNMDIILPHNAAQRVYETIFTVINNRHKIGYYSTNQMRDGRDVLLKKECAGILNILLWDEKVTLLTKEKNKNNFIATFSIRQNL
jgi:hypothetical protein